MPPSSAQLGAAITSLRHSRELTIESLAADAGIHFTHLSRVEKGRKSPTWDTVAAIAEALGVEVADLARLAADQPPPDS